ncbi:hypothetical protein, partial [Burkholderia multivorans]|uniref:hypothetical protein n=1 Tax=Burkholderia multivorans TaxID=87883 RepID=UPI001C6155AE
MSDVFVSAFAHRTRMSAAVRRRSPEAPEAGECRVRAACDGRRRAAGGVGAGHVEAASKPRRAKRAVSNGGGG